MVAECLDMFLLGNVDVCAGRLGWFGGAEKAAVSMCLWNGQGQWCLLIRYLALSVFHPVDLATTHLPFVTQGVYELGLGEAGRKTSTYQFQAGLSSLWAAGRRRRRVLLEKGHGQDAAVGAWLRGHGGRKGELVMFANCQYRGAYDVKCPRVE